MCEGDLPALREMLQFAELGGLMIHRPSNAKEFMTTVGGGHCLIGVRLHSAVLACASGILPILIAYRDKCYDFMESLNLEHLTVNLAEDSGPAITSAYTWVMSNSSYRTTMFRRVRELRLLQALYAREIINQTSAKTSQPTVRLGARESAKTH
jgi:hypothetical protein